MSGYSGTPLSQKLGIRAGARLFVRGAPASYPKLLAPLPAGVRTVSRIDRSTDVIHLFATRRAELEGLLRRALASMRCDATVWVSWPKKTAGVASDVSEAVIRELALPTGLVDVKVCAVDATWSGLKLVLRRTHRSASTVSRRATPAKAARRPAVRVPRRARP